VCLGTPKPVRWSGGGGGGWGWLVWGGGVEVWVVRLGGWRRGSALPRGRPASGNGTSREPLRRDGPRPICREKTALKKKKKKNHQISASSFWTLEDHLFLIIRWKGGGWNRQLEKGVIIGNGCGGRRKGYASEKKKGGIALRLRGGKRRHSLAQKKGS